MNYENMNNEDLLQTFRNECENLGECPNSIEFDRTQNEVNIIQQVLQSRLT